VKKKTDCLTGGRLFISGLDATTMHDTLPKTVFSDFLILYNVRKAFGNDLDNDGCVGK